MKTGDFPIFIITIWIKMMRYSRNICMTMGGIMKRTKLKRKVLFDITKDRDDLPSYLRPPTKVQPCQ